MSYTDVIDAIEQLKPSQPITCRTCSHRDDVCRLTIYHNCVQCGTRMKLRGTVAMGSEIEDVIDAVLSWLREHEVPNAQ